MTHILRSKAPELVEARTLAPNVRKSHHILNELVSESVNNDPILMILEWFLMNPYTLDTNMYLNLGSYIDLGPQVSTGVGNSAGFC